MVGGGGKEVSSFQSGSVGPKPYWLRLRKCGGEYLVELFKDLLRIAAKSGKEPIYLLEFGWPPLQ